MKQKWKGEGYIDTVVFFLVVILGVALIVNVLPIFTVKQDLDHFAKAVMREVEVTGDANIVAIAGKIASLRDATGLEPELEIEAESYINGSKIQIDTEFTVVCTYTVSIGNFGGFSGFDIPLTAMAIGRSEVYWK